jgi:hypothetical protein
MNFKCQFCSLVLITAVAFIDHLRKDHLVKDGDDVGCPKCQQKFFTLSGLRRHILNCKKQPTEDTLAEKINDVNPTRISDSDTNSSASPSVIEDLDEEFEIFDAQMNKFLSNIMIKKIPESLINYILTTFKSYFEFLFFMLNGKIVENPNNVTNILTSASQNYSLIFSKHLTTYKRRKTTFQTVPMPKTITIKQHLETFRDKLTGEPSQKKCRQHIFIHTDIRNIKVFNDFRSLSKTYKKTKKYKRIQIVNYRR